MQLLDEQAIGARLAGAGAVTMAVTCRTILCSQGATQAQIANKNRGNIRKLGTVRGVGV